MKRTKGAYIGLAIAWLFMGGGAVRTMSVPAQANRLAQTAEDWPMLGHDLARSGASGDQVGNPVPLHRDLTIRWMLDLASTDSAESELINFGVQPIVVDGVVYVPTLSNRLYALDGTDGSPLWIFKGVGVGAMLNSPAVVGGTAYIGSTDGYLYAINADNGARRWRFAAGRGGFGASPAVTADAAYIGGRDGVFYAINVANGSALWTYDVGAPIIQSAAVDESHGRIYVGAEDMRVYAFSTSGDLLWQSDQLAGRSFRHYYPVLASDTLFVRTNPAINSNTALEQGDLVIMDAAGVSSLGSDRAVCSEDPLNITAAWTQSGWDAEITAIRDFLTDNPEYQTFYALDIHTGQPRYLIPVLWSGGSGHVGMPPVVRDGQHILLYLRSYYSNYDRCDTWFLFGGFGQLEVATGQISILNLNEQSSDGFLWRYGINVIGDEQNTLTLSGDILYVTSHGDTVGGIDLTDLSGVRGMITRDNPWGINSRNLPFMGQVSSPLHELPSPREGAGAIVPYGDTIYWVTMSTVGALEGVEQ